MKLRPMTRSLSWFLVAAAGGPGCDGGASLTTVATTTQATSEGSKDSNGQEDTGSLLITGAVVLGLSAAATLIGFTADDSADFSYLQRHQQEVRVALARGDGPFMTDLAQRLRLPRDLVPHLAAVLRGTRAELERPLAGGHIDEPRAHAFSRALVLAIAQDPILSPYLDEALVVVSAR